MEDSLFTFNSNLSVIKNQYFIFFKKICIFLFILIVADQITGSILRYFYFKQLAGPYYRATYTIDSTKADILVFGSSRASHSYVPEIFEEKFKMSFFNTGRDGNYLLYNYATFKSVTSRYSPKIIIFDLQPNELYYDSYSYESLSSLLPYYKNHQEIREIIEMRSSFEKLKLLSAIYPFNSLIINIGVSNLELSNTKYSNRKGYLPIYTIMKESKADNALKLVTDKFDFNKIKALKEIAAICKKKNIYLVISYSPIFNNTTSINTTKLIEEITKAYQCQYLDFSNDTTFDSHPKYFETNVHLNDDGAKIYSDILSTIIFKFMNKTKI